MVKVLKDFFFWGGAGGQTAKINHKLCAHQCHEGFWTSRSPSPSDHPAHANQPADQSTVCEGKSETHKGSFKLWTSNKSLTSSKNSVPADPTLAVEANLFSKDVQYWKLRPT